MQKNFGMIVAIGVLLPASSGLAAQLKPCSGINAVKERLDCVEGNVALVNATLETVAAELRKAIGEIKGVTDKLPPTFADDLKKAADAVTWGAPLRIKGRPDYCLTWVDINRQPTMLTCDHPDLQGFSIIKPQ